MPLGVDETSDIEFRIHEYLDQQEIHAINFERELEDQSSLTNSPELKKVIKMQRKFSDTSSLFARRYK